MRHLTTVLDLLATGLVVTGAALIYVPAAFVLAGVGTYLVSRRFDS